MYLGLRLYAHYTAMASMFQDIFGQNHMLARLVFKYSRSTLRGELTCPGDPNFFSP